MSLTGFITFGWVFIMFCWIEHPWICEAPDNPLDSSIVMRLKQFRAMNKLKKVALKVYLFLVSYSSLLKTFTSFHDLVHIVQFWNFYLISRFLFIQFIAETLTEEEISGLKSLFQSMDLDNSGSLTMDELKQGLAKQGTILSQSEVHELLKAVNCYSSLFSQEYI